MAHILNGILNKTKPTVIDKVKDAFILYFQSILAGILIGIAGTIYLSVDNKILGAGLFSVGLLAIIALDIPLFTGKVGYLFSDDEITIAKLLIILVGNLNGTNLMSFLVIPMPIYKHFDIKVDDMVITTLSNTWSATLCASILCGIFMYIAVEGYKRTIKINPTAGAFITIASVMGFILTGSLHCIANMFYIYACRSIYFISSSNFDYRPMCWVLIMIAGNAIGSQLTSLLQARKEVSITFSEQLFK